MKCAAFFLAIAICGTAAGGARALELHQCSLRIAFTAEGVQPVELPRSRFQSWSRAKNARDAALGQANVTRYCAQMMVFGNYSRVPAYCRDKPGLLMDPKKQATGLKGFAFLRGRAALKEAVCARPAVGKPAGRQGTDEATDKRVLIGFRLFVNQRGGTGKCPDHNVIPVMTLTVYCRMPNGSKVRDRRGGAGWTLYRFVKKP